MTDVFLPFFLVFLLVSLEGGGDGGSPPPPAASADSAGAPRKMAVTTIDKNRTVDWRMRLSRFPLMQQTGPEPLNIRPGRIFPVPRRDVTAARAVPAAARSKMTKMSSR